MNYNFCFFNYTLRKILRNVAYFSFFPFYSLKYAKFSDKFSNIKIKS
jgi:hypothetical protein